MDNEQTMMNNNDILSVLNGQTSVLTYAFNPETIAFRNKVIELQKNCSMVEWEHDMGATIPYCKLNNSFCNGQCSFNANDCSCDKDSEVETNATEKIINDLNVAKLILCNPEMFNPEMCISIGQVITNAINLLKEHKEQGDIKTMPSGQMTWGLQYGWGH